MIRKIFTLLLLFVTFAQAQAQFESGKKYIGASATDFGLTYSKGEDFRLGLDADLGYFIADGFLLKGNLGYAHTQDTDHLRVGAGLRYHFIQNGVFVGTGAEYAYSQANSNQLLFPLELGYSFFINGHLTIEPSVYYKISANNFKDDSTFGIRVGMGFFF